MLKFNPDTKVIFDNDEAAVAPIREITRDEIPDLIANGAGFDPSANAGEQTSSPAPTDGDARVAQDAAVSATGSDTAGEQGNAEQTAVNAAVVEQDAGSGTTSVAPVELASQPGDDAVPLGAGGTADAEAGSAEAGESDAALSASQTGSGSDEHPLTIIGEIEALVRMIGNSAVHEYQRLIQRLADLKNHPTIKDGE
jgi:hypothetical protein